MDEQMGKITDVAAVAKNDPEVVLDMLKKADSFFVGVTIKTGDKLQHEFISKDFPIMDLLRSWAKVKNLIVQEIEESTNDVV